MSSVHCGSGADGARHLKYSCCEQDRTSGRAQPLCSEEENMDPAGVIAVVGSGLKLIDQFRELALRWSGRNSPAPSMTAEQKGDAIEIKHDGQVLRRVETAQLRMDAFDETRYRALERRITANWALFHELYAQTPLLAVDEQARIKLRMERLRDELCQDFRSVMRIYEAMVGGNLPDHYSLNEICT